MIRKTFLLSGILCVLSICTLAGATFAYLTDHTKLDNVMKIGQNVSILKETFPTPAPIDPDTVQTYEKVVSVNNMRKVPCYARVFVAFSNDAIGDQVSFINLNKTDWEYIDSAANASLEGYYYYKYPIEPGDSTSPLFEGLRIGDNLDFSDDGADGVFQVFLYEETLQCEPYDNYQDAWDAFIRE